MTEETINQEAVTQAANVESSTETIAETVEAVEPTEAAPKEEGYQAKNFKVLREAREKAERERDAALAKFRELETQRQASQQRTEEDDFIRDDDFVEAHHVKKVNAEVKRLQKELEDYKKQSTLATTEARLKAKYQDFEQVVTPDNVEKLKVLHPELAQTLESSKDLYSTAVSAYTLIKKLGIIEEDSYGDEKERAQKNLSKPRPTTSAPSHRANSPLGNADAFANGLTDDLKKQLWKEMNEAAKRG